MKVNRSVTVQVPADRAFRAFTEEIGQWWLASFTFIEKDHQNTVLDEGRRSLVSDRDRRQRARHRGGPSVRASHSSAVHLGAARLGGHHRNGGPVHRGGGGTRVDLEHRGFETVGPKGEDSFKEYNGGWVDVLAHYEKYAA